MSKKSKETEKSKATGIECPYCGHFYKGHTNLFGKICIHCKKEIPSDYKLPIVEENEKKNEKLLEMARDSIRRKIQKGE